MKRGLLANFRGIAFVFCCFVLGVIGSSAAQAAGFSEFRSVGSLAAFLGAPLPNASGGNPWRAYCGESARLSLTSSPAPQEAKVIARIGSLGPITEDTRAANSPELLRWMAEQRERKFSSSYEPREDQWGIPRAQIFGGSAEYVDYPDYSAALMEVVLSLRVYTMLMEECREDRRSNPNACTYRVGATDPMLEVRRNSLFNGSLRWQSSRIIPGEQGRRVDEMPRYREKVKLALEVLRTQFQIQLVGFNAENDGAQFKVKQLELILIEAGPSQRTTRFNPNVHVRRDGSLGISP